MLTWKLILASVAAALGCVGDGCILTATSTALAFRWTMLRAALTIGIAHFFYESLGLLLSTTGYLHGERTGLYISLLGALGLFFCVYRHSKHVHEHHDDGSECHHHEPKPSAGPLAAVSILFVTSADAFFAGVSIPAGFEGLPQSAFFLSAVITATTVGLITGGFIAFAYRREAHLSVKARQRFRTLSLVAAYAFIGWLFLSSAARLIGVGAI